MASSGGAVGEPGTSASIQAFETLEKQKKYVAAKGWRGSASVVLTFHRLFVAPFVTLLTHSRPRQLVGSGGDFTQEDWGNKIRPGQSQICLSGRK
ncbi:hypothetical protein BaRGS_00020270 [Batillaria attramentaria]|uniref:Uncharacterized protein n=1 Tax=Batillaria attramentaria TaxID=370345 RepID=A0ABD0KNM4_9CAEN